MQVTLEVIKVGFCRNQLNVISKKKHVSLKKIRKVIHVAQEKYRAKHMSLGTPFTAAFRMSESHLICLKRKFSWTY